jgi:hypothetical protein
LISATGNITGGNVISGGVRVYKWTTQANTAPSTPVPGDSWYDSYASKLYLYVNDGTGNQWVDQSFPTSFANLSVTGNIQGGNVTTTGLVSATGNVTGNYFIGNGSALTGIATGTPTQIVNGTSNVSVASSGGNATVGIGGTANVVVVATTGAYVTGIVSATANVTGSNILTAGQVSATANITSGNLLTGGLISAAGTVTGTSHLGAVVSVTGAITGAAITGSSLTVSTGNVSAGNIVNNNANGVGNIGNATGYFNTVFGKATTAQYADLAELYSTDAEYAPGTVLVFGGNNEVTISTALADPRVAGVVSTNPAHLMNSILESKHKVAVALTGRVPTSVVGTVRKGDMMVTAGNGSAQASATPAMGTVIGKALENFDGASGVIEIVVGRL